jgi:hypothetical protein
MRNMVDGPHVNAIHSDQAAVELAPWLAWALTDGEQTAAGAATALLEAFGMGVG